jgi:hypothetical protein
MQDGQAADPAADDNDRLIHNQKQKSMGYGDDARIG